MTLAAHALQRALYQRLLADPGLKAELGDPPRVYDEPPSSAVFPYLVFGEARVGDYAGVDGAAEHDLRFSVHSRHGGRREVKRVLDALYVALHEADFPVDGARLIQLRFVFADIFRRQDGESHQGAARFRAVTTPLTSS